MTASNPRVIDVRFGSLMPWAFHFLAGLAILAALVLGLHSPLIALLLVFGSLFIFTSNEGTEIDLAGKRYREYTALFFMKTGEWLPFDEIEKIYVNKNKVRQRMSAYRTGKTAEFVYSEFSAFLKFSDEETVQLKKFKDKDKLMRHAKVWADQLNVPLYDNT
ncbi:MAG TPA: hypothetical protein VK658_24405 [Chryseolinea sp.]|nr:hypothetical protein [Chryseolinea sp.]